jgi:hypothetical protein
MVALADKGLRCTNCGRMIPLEQAERQPEAVTA